MNFFDVVYKILAEGYAPSEYKGMGIAAAMLASIILSIYIFFCYRLVGRRTFYSASYNLMLLIVGPVTAALILLISQNAIFGIGVVGALSIVRLRGPIKEPLDLVFILWAVACGIFIAAGRWRVGIIVSIIMTAVVILMDILPLSRASLILSVYGREGDKTDLQKACSSVISRNCRGVKKISEGRSGKRKNLVLKIHTNQRLRLTNELANLPEVDSVTLVEQTGEVSF